MNIKMICLGAFALASVSGTAFAGALDQPDMMSPFYTDNTMKTMKSDDDLKAAWSGMKKEDQDAMKSDCNDTTMRAQHTEFCSTMGRLWGNS